MKKNVCYILILSIMLFSQACENSKGENKEIKTIEESYSAIQVHTDNPAKKLRLPAELSAFEEVSIYPKVNGFVKEMMADMGTEVKKGQLLAVLDAPELDAQLAEARSKMFSAAAITKASQSAYSRLLRTSKTPGAISMNDLEQSEARMLSDSAASTSAQSNYKALEEVRNYLRVTAPFDGIVTERNVSPGALVGPAGKSKDMPLFQLKEEKKLRLTAALPEIYTGQVIQGKELVFKVKAFPGKEFKGLLARKAGSLNKSIRSEMIELDVDNTNMLLKSGMYAEIDFTITRSVPSIYVPKSAVVSSTEKLFVLKIVDGITQKTDIQRGNELDDKVEIIGGIHEGDLILKNANDEIPAGKRIHFTLEKQVND